MLKYITVSNDFTILTVEDSPKEQGTIPCDQEPAPEVGWVWDGRVARPAAIARKLEVLYSFVDKLALQQVDYNARFRYLAWLYDPSASASKKAKITDVLAWLDLLWSEYGIRRASVLSTGTCEWYTAFPPCPFTFWDIVNA